MLTWHNDNARTGQNLQETILTPGNVNASTFRKLFVISVDGKVDAQPLYVPSVTISGNGIHNMLYVLTEHDTAFAFDADSALQLWRMSLLGANETTSDDRGCNQVTPEIGVTSTPVIDPQTGPHGTMYVVAVSKDGQGNYHHRLHALDLATGAEQFGGPVEIQATYPGSGVEGFGGTLTFNPRQHNERAALVILNGVVYTSWSSHCDQFPYTSWVIGYSETTLAQVSALNLTPNGSDGGIWASGSGPAADAAANLYLLTGNGTFDTTPNTFGFPVNGDYGNAFLKLSTSGGALVVADYFTMSNTTSESGGDVDLGSGGVLLLPPLNDANGQPQALAVGAGKDQHIYVVDRNNLGKFSPVTNLIYQDLPNSLTGPVFSSPAWFNGKLYYGAVGDHLKAFVYLNGAFGASSVSQSSNTFGYPGTTPSISANGTLNGIVWAAENGDPAVLHAYDAADLSRELYNSAQAANGRDNFGSGNKFIVPTVVNGKVYVGTTNGVGVFGLACSYAITPQSAEAPAGGGPQTISVIATSGCGWTAVSNAAWLTVTGGSSGVGNGTVGLSVAANPAVDPRTGTIAIDGQLFTVNQAGTALSQALQFVPVTSCRVVDTRNPNGPFGGPELAGGTLRSFAIPAGGCNIPFSAAAYSLNVTVVPVTSLGYLTVWPSGQSQPLTSTFNSLDGRIKANAAIVAAGSGGGINVYVTNSTQLILDIDGYFVPAGSSTLAFYPLTPCRVADTRNATSSLGGPYLPRGASRAFPILLSSCSIPSTAKAYSLNFTAVPHGPLGYLTVWQTGETQPLTSTLNALTGAITANAAIVLAGSGGEISVYPSDDTDLVIDVNGYFAPPAASGLSLHAMAPCRVLDTRTSTGQFGGILAVNVAASGCGALVSAAQGFVLNATVVPAGGLGYLTVWPNGQTQPLASTLNALDGGRRCFPHADVD